MNILCISNGTASHLWRISPYLRYAQEQGHGVLMHTPGHSVADLEVMWADVVIAEMILEKRVVDIAHKYGASVIYEIDDVIEKVTKNHPNYINMRRLSTMWRTFKCIHASDAVFCSNSVIEGIYGKFNRNTHIIPNYVDIDYWLKPPNPNTGSHIRIGWAGSFAHYDDLKFFQPIMKRIIDKYPEVKFIYIGMGGWHGGNPHTKFQFGEDIFADIPVKNREYHQGVEALFWATKLNSLQLDIGVAPIVDNQFSRAKTPIKWMEYAVNRVPFVGSYCLYSRVVKHRDDGFLAENADEFYNYLCKLIEDKNLREQMGQKAHDRVTNEFDITKYQTIWLKKVQQIRDTAPTSYLDRKEKAIREFQKKAAGDPQFQSPNPSK